VYQQLSLLHKKTARQIAMKIVIVDDDKTMRGVLRALCEGEGYEVVAEFGDGVGLLDYVTAHHPDVVCLDFNLPGEDGLALLTNLDVTANHVDVIMITGSEDPDLKGRAADLGATGFIHKPFEHAQIIAELKDIAETRRIAARTSETPATSEPALPALPVSGRGTDVMPRTAVIIDDSGSIRLLLKGILEELGIKVIGAATNGRSGIEVVKRMHPALVCLDVDMPGMTGIEALPEVCSASPKTKVVMVTGNASRPVVEAAISGGARGYFLKPIRPAKVEEFMKKLLRL
jgi:DNA-binding NarL/FixJ family response regulator